jgi:hypothetical protein
MEKNLSVTPIQRSPFGYLAAFFHQDFDLLFPNFDAGMSAYVSGLKAEQRVALREDVEKVLLHAEDEADVRKAWRLAGAEWTAKGINLRSELIKLSKIL